VTFSAENLKVLFLTKKTFNEGVPVFEPSLGVHNRLDMIDLNPLGREFFLAGIAPEVLGHPTSILVNLLFGLGFVQDGIFRGPPSGPIT